MYRRGSRAGFGFDDVDGPTLYDIRKDVHSGFLSAEFGDIDVKHWKEGLSFAHVYPKNRIKGMLRNAKQHWPEVINTELQAALQKAIRESLKEFIGWLFYVDPEAEIIRLNGVQTKTTQKFTGKYPFLLLQVLMKRSSY